MDKLDFETVKREALAYKSRSSFKNNSIKAYNFARKNGWLDMVCDHMLPRCKWDVEKAKAEVSKYSNKTELRKNNASVYNWVVKNNLASEVFQNLPGRKPRGTRIKWTLEMVESEAKKYSCRAEFVQSNHNAYNWARTHGFLDKVCRHMVPLKKRHTLAHCLELAKRCKNKREFREKHYSEYQWVLRNHCDEECFIHMPKRAENFNKKKIASTANVATSTEVMPPEMPVGSKASQKQCLTLPGCTNPSSTYKTLLAIDQIKHYAKSTSELAEITGESVRHVKRRLKQARQWGADISCKKEKAENGGLECFYVVKNYQDIKPILDAWTAIEKAVLNKEKPLLLFHQTVLTPAS